MALGKNVSMTPVTIDIVRQYMNKTKQNFSATLNQIIMEWDNFSIELEKFKREQHRKKAELQANLEIKNLKSAKVIKT